MSVPLLYFYVMALFERTKRLYGFPGGAVVKNLSVKQEMWV